MRFRIAYHCNGAQPVTIKGVSNQPHFYIPTRREVIRESLIEVRDDLIALKRELEIGFVT